MPTYEYRCKDCGHQFDAVQSFTDDALTECPSCGGPLKKVFGNVGIAFKGSGFYKTDSRSGSSSSSTSSTSSSSSGDGDSSSSSSDKSSSADKTSSADKASSSDKAKASSSSPSSS